MLDQEYVPRISSTGSQANPQRVALALSYDGSRYHGWQSQSDPTVETVQDALERSLSAIADHKVRVQCAGRTDAGVHACFQLVHFDCYVDRPCKAWVQGGNALLPDDIAISWAVPVPQKFHARFSAEARRYRYIIYNAAVRPALLNQGLTWVRVPLNEVAMREAAQCLSGEHDFSSFRASGCQSRTAIRNLHFVEVYRRNRIVIVDIKANAFLLHMVRNIVGSLMCVGSGEKSIDWFQQVFKACDRTLAGVTAKPNGLYLIDVIYNSQWQFPETELGPEFLQISD